MKMLVLNNSENHLSFGFQDNISDDSGNKTYDEANTSSNDSYQNISIDEDGKEKMYLEERSLHQIIRGKKLNEEHKLERIKQYIKEGYDISTQTEKKGDTLLHYAALNRSIKIIKYLIEQKADISLKNKAGESALHCAAYQGKLEIIKLFIEEQNINPNIRDKSGSTPLHHASSKGRLQAVKYLVEKGADFNVKNQVGNTPLDLAKKNERNDVVSYLELRNSKRVVINARFALTILCLTVVPYLATLYTSVILLVMTFSLTKLLTSRLEKLCKGIGEQSETSSISTSGRLTYTSFKAVNNDQYISS